jgi:hypothetical protein
MKHVPRAMCPKHHLPRIIAGKERARTVTPRVPLEPVPLVVSPRSLLQVLNRRHRLLGVTPQREQSRVAARQIHLLQIPKFEHQLRLVMHRQPLRQRR